MTKDESRIYQGVKELAARTLAESPTFDLEEREQIRKQWRLADLANRLAQANDYKKLYEILELKHLPLEQAKSFNGFGHPSRDLESIGLPAAAKERDWRRFSAFAMRALQYRRLADILSDPAVLETLIQFGNQALARDVWKQLRDPLLRARAAAIVIVPPSSARSAGATEVVISDSIQEERDPFEVLVDELQAIGQLADEEEAKKWLEILQSVAGGLVHEMAGYWSQWVARLKPWPHLRDAGWRGVAKGWLEARTWHNEGFLPIVEGLGSKAGEALVELASLSPQHLPHLIASLAEEPRWAEAEAHVRLLHLALQMLAGRATLSESTLDHLNQLHAWSPSLVEAGKSLWPFLNEHQVNKIRDRLLASPPATVAFETILLAAKAPTAQLESLFTALNELFDESAQIRGAVRWLRIDSQPERHRQVLRALALHLFHERYQVSDQDLVAFLDLVARGFPADLEEHLEGCLRQRGAAAVVASGAAERLRFLAREAQSSELRKLLLDDAEKWGALAGRDELEGFTLRAELLRILGSRQARECGSERIVTELESRVLPSEEDSFLEAIALSMEKSVEAEKISSRISDPVVRLQTLVRVIHDPEKLRQSIQPERLLAVARESTLRQIRQEVRALGVLLEVPRDPEALTKRLEDVRDPDRHILAVYELVESALQLQASAYSPWRRDFAGAMRPLADALAAGGTEEFRLGLIPELVHLASMYGPRGHELGEWREAWLKILRFRSVPWPRRVELLERLVSDLLREVDSAPTWRLMVERSHRIAQALSWAAQLIFTLAPDDAARTTLEGHGHEVVTLLVASAESSGWVNLILRCPHTSKLTLGALRNLVGNPQSLGRATEDLATLFDRWHWRPTPWVGRLDAYRAAWRLSEKSQQIFDLALIPRRERGAQIDSLLQGVAWLSEPSLISAILPLVRNDPERLQLLLERLDDDSRRTAALRLARCGRLGSVSWPIVEHALRRYGEEAVGRVWRGIWDASSVEDDPWIRDLSGRLGEGDFDPRNPANLPIVRRLRKADRETALIALASAVPRALAHGGDAAGEVALFMWLRTYLAYIPGVGNRAALADLWEPIEKGLRVGFTRFENADSVNGGLFLH